MLTSATAQYHSLLKLILNQFLNSLSISICLQFKDVFQSHLPIIHTNSGAQVCSVPLYQNVTQYLVNTVTSILPDNGKAILEIGELLNNHYFPTEYAQEIQGCAQALVIRLFCIKLMTLGNPLWLGYFIELRL